MDFPEMEKGHLISRHPILVESSGKVSNHFSICTGSKERKLGVKVQSGVLDDCVDV